VPGKTGGPNSNIGLVWQISRLTKVHTEWREFRFAPYEETGGTRVRWEIDHDVD